MLRFVLYTVFGVAIILLITASVLPSTYRVERSIVIDKPSHEIYPYVAGMGHWPEWSPWHKDDTSSTSTYNHNDIAGMGGHLDWTNDFGKGFMTIEHTKQHKFIQSRLRFEHPFEIEGEHFWHFEDHNTEQDKTLVIWKSEGRLGYPLGRFYGYFINEEMGRNFEQGLDNLKLFTETN